jgi:hypothetical protein
MEPNMKDLALQWFTGMQAGQFDRTQYASAYSTQLTDEAVQQMTHLLNQYGASPNDAEIMQSHTAGDQTFHVVKFVFPRGDATSILFGLDTAGKITGVAVRSFAGD